tara:strand:+ start:844 stop:1437 length:594 start_codon:yes stop_codon:yes gene_type:complete
MNQILDFVVITLLIITIVYGIILSRKINVIRDSKKDLANLFSSFDQTILIAQSSIDELSRASKEAESGLQAKIDKASLLMDDLAFLSERASVVAEKMMQGVGGADYQSSQSKVGNMPSPAEIRQLKQMTKNAAMANAKNRSVHPKGGVQSNQQERQQVLESLLSDIAKQRQQPGNASQKPDRQSIQKTLESLGYKSK